MKPLTRGQRKYMDELKDGPKTTGDMVLSLMVCEGAVAKMMKKMRKAGRVKSLKVVGVHGNIWEHEMIPPSVSTY